MTDQPDPAERRTRYAAAMAVRDGDTWPTTYENDEADYLRRADAAMAVADAEMAVLPAPVDRAAVLREAADVIVADNDRQMWATKPGKHWAADLLRRMADEAQQPACGNCGHPAAWHDPWEGCVGPDGIGSAGSGDCTCTRSPDEAQQPEEAGR